MSTIPYNVTPCHVRVSSTGAVVPIVAGGEPAADWAPAAFQGTAVMPITTPRPAPRISVVLLCIVSVPVAPELGVDRPRFRVFVFAAACRYIRPNIAVFTRQAMWRRAGSIAGRNRQRAGMQTRKSAAARPARYRPRPRELLAGGEISISRPLRFDREIDFWSLSL